MKICIMDSNILYPAMFSQPISDSIYSNLNCSMSQIVLYLSKSTVLLSFYIDVALTHFNGIVITSAVHNGNIHSWL